VPAIYTVHGFHFHDDMPWVSRRFFVAIESLLGRITRHFMFVSKEDQCAALREGIARRVDATTWICNGIDLQSFPPKSTRLAEADAMRTSLRIAGDAPVVGIVARVVKEKGYQEFFEMAAAISAVRPSCVFLVVGDALPSDRGSFARKFRAHVRAAGLEDRFRFTGFTDCVAGFLQVMDVFVLPSYREGFPRSVLEAMGSELPVVTANIRGCRESVVDGITGLLVPPRDSKALTSAVLSLLDNSELRRRMGQAGRSRVQELYDERFVQHRITCVFERLLGGVGAGGETRQARGCAASPQDHTRSPA
jgi:glycosyltransferase involved in cell wall biosynthesis